MFNRTPQRASHAVIQRLRDCSHPGMVPIQPLVSAVLFILRIGTGLGGSRTRFVMFPLLPFLLVGNVCRKYASEGAQYGAVLL